MANKKNLFMARKVEVEYLENAKLLSAREVLRKQDGKAFKVGKFVDPDGVTADIVFPDGWEPLGFDIYFGDSYDIGWVPGDIPGKSLFKCRPAEWKDN